MTPAASRAAETAETDAKEFAQNVARSFFEKRFEYEQLDGEVTLVENGKAACAIVIPVSPAPPVEFAAHEIQYYLEKITGAEVPIVRSHPAEGAAIVLGDRPETRRAGINVDHLARDGCQIVVRDQTVYIAGKDDNTERAANLFILRDTPNGTPTGYHDWDFNRGTLYGAYRFLEELGVRWFMPTEAGESVPETTTLSLPANRPPPAASRVKWTRQPTAGARPSRMATPSPCCRTTHFLPEPASAKTAGPCTGATPTTSRSTRTCSGPSSRVSVNTSG